MMIYNEFIKDRNEINEKSKISKKELLLKNKKLALKLIQFKKERILKSMNKFVAGPSVWDHR